jgi:hypothetical protein
MNRSQPHPSDPGERRNRITIAVITSLLAGAARALVDWLLNHLTTGS